ncbi:TetR family transcriptional regulator [Lactiplantibacillus pentosus]|uniref:TetR family transcriptional regulator n=1 Tax=Lactiplantibacillus pentosus TaxID=1589 RepID=UPI003D16C4AA
MLRHYLILQFTSLIILNQSLYLTCTLFILGPDSFQGLVEDKGFKRVSITLIMKRAEVRRPTFYDYFKDKYDLLE